MGISPQFIYGKDGLPTNVVISFEEWQQLQDQMAIDVPLWQIEETLRRLAEYRVNPGAARSLESFLGDLTAEDGV